MEKTQKEYGRVIEELLNKAGMFTEKDIKTIRSIPSEALVDFFKTMRDKKHFRYKYFNSQKDFLAILYESSMGLIEESRKVRKMNVPKRIPKRVDLEDGRWDFLANIGAATPQQIQQIWDEGVRMGINVPEAPSRDIPMDDGAQQLDEDFGEAAAASGSRSIEFAPRSSSTPLKLQPLPQLQATNLDTIMEDNEVPPPPMRLSQDALDPNQMEQEAPVPPTPRRSQYTPVIPHPGTMQARVIPFHIDEVPQPAAEPEETPVIPQDVQEQPVAAAPPVDEPQPDFNQLRLEALQRHISTPPVRPRPTRRRVRKQLECWDLRDVQPKLLTEHRLRELLRPALYYPTLHIYVPEVEDTTNSSAAQERQNSIIQKSSSSLPQNASVSREVQVPQLPSIVEVQTDVQVVQSMEQEIPQQIPMPDEQIPLDPQLMEQQQPVGSGIPEAAAQNIPEVPIPDVPIPDVPIPEVTIPDVPIPPEVAQQNVPPAQEAVAQQQLSKPPGKPFPLPNVVQTERIQRICKLLYARRVITIEDFKEEFSDRFQMAGVFRSLLEFNGILWKMSSNDKNELIAVHKL